MAEHQTCHITWNGEVHDFVVPYPVTAALVLEAFLGVHPDLRQSGQKLALFTAGGTELEGHEQVSAGDDLILRPRIVP